MKYTLSFGQTPWDNLSDKRRLALIRELRNALASAVPTMEAQRLDERNSIFWRHPEGSGTGAYARTIRALELTRDEPRGSAGLLKAIVALYRAVECAAGAIGMCAVRRHGEPPNPELEALDSVLTAAAKTARRRRNATEIYRCFTKYADELIFAGTPKLDLSFNWCVCRVCNVVVSGNGVVADGPCSRSEAPLRPCAGTYRKYTWADIRPELAD